MARSLYQIREWPLDLSLAVYQEYPFFKLGVAASVQYYAERLAPLLEEIMVAKSHYSRWVLTGPRFYRIPTAANLLCWAIFEVLKPKNSPARTVSVVNLYKPKLTLETAGDFSQYNDYSKYAWEDRLKLMREHQIPVNGEDFEGCGVVFIDDINVTGTKQENMRDAFAGVYPNDLNWLYIVDCEQSIGRKEPQLESQINNFKIKSALDFGAILARNEIQYTTKCLSKVFTYSVDELTQMLPMLESGQRSRLWAALMEEDLYRGDFFKEKMDLMQRQCRK